MNVSLTPTLEALVQAKVASGLYNNASEVIREALRIMDEHDQIKALKMEVLKKELNVALAALDKDEYSTSSVNDIADRVLKNYQSQ